jgi:HTH-type transcriptional regulator, competence development regulator
VRFVSRGEPVVDPATIDSVNRIVYDKSMKTLGDFLRTRRLELQARDERYSLTQVAQRVGVTPAFLSQVERGLARSGPAEETLVHLARELEVDADVLLALAGKVSSDLQAAIRRRPTLFAQLIRELRDLPDHAVLRLVREVRDGEW